jgi:hypothetical protein
MADLATTSRAAHRSDAGFTLAEMLAALGILLFGVVALIGAMTSSIAQRRTTDARHELCALCDHAVHRVLHECVRSPSGSSVPTDLEFVPLQDQSSPGFPGMRWSARVESDPDLPLLWLVHIDVRWNDAGEEVQAGFLRVVPRQLSLRERVLTFRSGGADSASRAPATPGQAGGRNEK